MRLLRAAFAYGLIVIRAYDPFQHLGIVDTGRVPNTSAVLVAEGIDRQDDIRAA